MPDLSSQNQYKRVSGTAAGTTVVLDRNGSFERVIFNQQQTGTVTFYDTNVAGGSAATNFITVMNNTVGSIPASVEVGARVKTGLIAVVGGTTDLTVVYN